MYHTYHTPRLCSCQTGGDLTGQAARPKPLAWSEKKAFSLTPLVLFSALVTMSLPSFTTFGAALVIDREVIESCR